MIISCVLNDEESESWWHVPGGTADNSYPDVSPAAWKFYPIYSNKPLNYGDCFDVDVNIEVRQEAPLLQFFFIKNLKYEKKSKSTWLFGSRVIY
jgi:hypothetical protein